MWLVGGTSAGGCCGCLGAAGVISVCFDLVGMFKRAGSSRGLRGGFLPVTFV